MSAEYKSKNTEPTERFKIVGHWSNGWYGGKKGGGWGFNAEPRWGVFLPHQCDEWQISSERESKEQALADLDAFIAELGEARRRLVAEEWGER